MLKQQVYILDTRELTAVLEKHMANDTRIKENILIAPIVKDVVIEAILRGLLRDSLGYSIHTRYIDPNIVNFYTSNKHIINQWYDTLWLIISNNIKLDLNKSYYMRTYNYVNTTHIIMEEIK